MTIAETLAVAICDSWWTVCEDRRRWPTTGEMERKTFRTMAAHALAAGRRGARDVEGIAEALCDGFWADALAERGVLPWPWRTLMEGKREVFRIVARRVLEVGSELRANRLKVAA